MQTFPSAGSSCIQNCLPSRQTWLYTLVHCEQLPTIIYYYSEKTSLLNKILVLAQIITIFQDCCVILKKTFSHMPSIYFALFCTKGLYYGLQILSVLLYKLNLKSTILKPKQEPILCCRISPEKSGTYLTWSKKTLYIQCSVLCSQKPDTGSYPEPLLSQLHFTP